jgi:DNA-binding CsgD family transcriptional regulator
MTEVLKLILEIASADTADGVWRIGTGFFAKHGFRRVNYGYTRFRSHNSVGDPDDALFLSTCGTDYVNRYFRGKFFARTPLYHWTESNVGACTWAWVKTAATEGRLTPDELASVKENQKIGVSSGVTISFPVHSSRSKGALGLIADPGLTDEDVESIWASHRQEIDAVAQVMHLKLIQFPIAGRTRPLTQRQREVLEWVADGKTTQDVATILGISAAMIEKHLRLAREVLGVDTTAQAVAKAALLNLIFIGSPQVGETTAIAAG